MAAQLRLVAPPNDGGCEALTTSMSPASRWKPDAYEPHHLRPTTGEDMEQFVPYRALGSQKIVVNNFGFTRSDEVAIVEDRKVLSRIIFPGAGNSLKQPLLCLAGLQQNETLIAGLHTYRVEILWRDKKYKPHNSELWTPGLAHNHVHQQIVSRVGEHSGMSYSVFRLFIQLFTSVYDKENLTRLYMYKPLKDFLKLDEIYVFNGRMSNCAEDFEPRVEHAVVTKEGLARLLYSVPVEVLRKWHQQHF